MTCVSALQKAIRRGTERDAMEFVCELMHTSKAFYTQSLLHDGLQSPRSYLPRRPRHIGCAARFPVVAASLAASRDRYSKSIGEARLMVGNAIRTMCRAPKSRAGCHFAAAIRLRAQFEGYAPEIPDWANDRHTLTGRKLGRGLDHFRKEGAKLIPPPTGDDPYEDEAYRLWAIKQQRK
ncbi:hypothetical protein AAE027_37805 [Bradyrhizobium japonicum]|uniref:hypothetical protein n=1 Tax=Bradyrhizobium sp. DN5 TaxID=3056950 RepID=UPI003525920E